jgi:hypothetical protein
MCIGPPNPPKPPRPPQPAVDTRKKQADAAAKKQRDRMAKKKGGQAYLGAKGFTGVQMADTLLGNRINKL